MRSAPDGTLYVGSGDGASYNAADRARAAHLRRAVASPARSCTSTARAAAWPGHPFCPTNADLTAGLHEGLRQGLPQPVPLLAAARRRPDRRRRRLEHDRGAQPRPRRGRPLLRLALLRGHRPHRRLHAPSRSARPSTPSRPARTPSPTASWCHCDAAPSRAWAARPTRAAPTRRPTATRSSTPTTSRAGSSGACPDGTTVDFATKLVRRRRPRARPGRATSRSSTSATSRHGTGSVRGAALPAGNQAPAARIVTDHTSGAGAAGRRVRRHDLQRPRRRPAHLPLGLRRRHHVHRGQARQDLHGGRHLRGAPHRRRRPRTHRDRRRDDHGGQQRADGRRSPRRPTTRCTATASPLTLAGSGTDPQDGALPGAS